MSTTPPFAIDISDIQYGHRKGPSWLIPRWQVAVGATVFMQAPSGAGKSTLLNVLAGLLPVRSGTLTVLNEPLHARRPAQTAPWRARNLGVIFQSLNLLDYLSCLDNILLAAHFAKNRQTGLSESARELMQKLNLPDKLLHKKAGELSVGQRQRVAIARALINNPALILADEPTSALDDENGADFIALLFDLVRERNCTLVFASHNKSLGDYFGQHIFLQDLSRPL
ncbi:ABC transporter ATP-binding protein [Gilvimarinus chinensis]|uniref:ABC transporter ATP-binding protein n=1 Tax=Gilvimarinus chinensis TaxID=396005 RepID=UPI00035CE5EF|nr:ATP-binding cassette domain-containing protein [Gilvimarinus chinensis]